MQTKKKILVFIDWYLPGYRAGGPIQSCANMVAHLHDKFDFYIVTRDADYLETQAYAGIKSDTWNEREYGTRVYYLSEDNVRYRRLKKIIEEQEFDAYYINGIYSLYFSILPLYILKSSGRKNIIVAPRGMLASTAIEVKSGKKKLFLTATKLLGLFNKVKFHSTSKHETADIKRMFPDSLVMEASNLPSGRSLENPRPIEKNVGELRLISVARIAPEKNLKYALEVLLHVKKKVLFNIYGPVYNHEYWAQCLAIINSMPLNVTVNYHGSIEGTKVLEAISDYHALFLPSLGENFGHIILQSLQAGRPVIISDRTPWLQLKEKNIGRDIPLAGMTEFAQTIDEFAQLSADTYNQMTRDCFSYAKAISNNNEEVLKTEELFR